MKLFGLQRIDGGLLVARSSGEQVLLALPAERTKAAQALGERLLALLDDPTEPHAHQTAAARAPSDLEDGLLAVGEGIEAGRTVWQAIRLLTRGRR